MVRLANVAKVGAGNSAPQDKALFEGGIYPFFRTADVGRVKVGELQTAHDYLNEQGIRGLKMHSAGTVLIPKSGASTFLDHRVIMTIDGYVSSHLATLHADEDVLDHRYLFWVMQTVSARDISTDTSYPTLSLGQISEIPIPLPPLEEQRWIVAVLGEAFAAIATATANAEKNLANARELFEAVLARSMDGAAKGWERRTLRSLGRTVTGNTPKTSNVDNFGDFVPFIKPGDFSADGTLDYENEGLSETGAVSSRLITSGSALMVCIGATIGKSGYAERDITANQQINALLPAPGVLGKFVYYQFLTAGFQNAVLGQSGQATLPIISKSKWNDLPVWLPSQDEQLLVVNELDLLLAERFRHEALVLRKLEMLVALKQSLLHRAFSGELTEREPFAA